MADDAAKSTSATENLVEQATTRPADADVTVTGSGADAESAAAAGETQKKDAASNDAAAAEQSNATEAAANDANPSSEAANAGSGPTTNGSANAVKKDNRRKSAGPAAESKGKKLSRKKSTVELRLDCEPGQVFWARTKGNPAWPCIICDESMLPDTLLSKRPVSAARADGTVRGDFADGGKNAKDRRFPIMFLGTNEFAWQVNTDLRPLEIDEVKELLAKGQTGKTTRKLWEAYEVCLEEHDLQYFKDMLDNHFEAAREEERQIAEAEAKKKEAKQAAEAAAAATPKSAKKEKGKRKSVAAVVEEDVEMPDAEEEEGEGKKSKPGKRKRKTVESEVEEKPAKTPKTTLKLKAPKEPEEEPTKKVQKTKVKKPSKGSDEDSSKAEDKPTLTEAELKEKTRKTVLYLRHRLQKGFLTRDSEPKEEEMADMADHFKSLEDYRGLEPEIIKSTKINKVLKAIIRLGSIPKDEEYRFKARSQELLAHWTETLKADTNGKGDGEDSKTNGVAHDDEHTASKSPEKDDGAKDEPSETAANPEESAPKSKPSDSSDAKPSAEIIVPAAA